jgi:hypothetical protein
MGNWMLANERNFQRWGDSIGRKLKDVVTKILEFQKDLETVLPKQFTGAEGIAREGATLEYRLRMERMNREAYKTVERTRNAPMMGIGTTTVTEKVKVLTDPELFNSIYQAHLRDTNATVDEIYNRWNSGYKNITNAAKTQFEKINEFQSTTMDLPDAFPTADVDALLGSVNALADENQVVVDKATALSTIMDEMGRMTKEVYAHQQKELRKLAATYEAAGVSAETANAWLREQNELLEIQRLKQGNLIDGWRAYILETKRGYKTAAAKAYEYASSMESAIMQGLDNTARDFDNWKEHVKAGLKEVYYEALKIGLWAPVASAGGKIFATIASSIASAFLPGAGGSGPNAATPSVGPASGGGGIPTTAPVPTTGFAEGGIAWTPQVSTLAEVEPEVITPFSKIGSLLKGGNIDVRLHNESGVPLKLTKQDQYAISNQRIIDVTISAASTNGSYRRAHKIGT